MGILMFKKIFLFALISLSSASFAGLLHEAAKRGDAAKVALLITEGKDVNEQDDFGNTALYLAAYRGHFDAVKALLAAGAGVNAQNNIWCKTALGA